MLGRSIVDNLVNVSFELLGIVLVLEGWIDGIPILFSSVVSHGARTEHFAGSTLYVERRTGG